MQSRKLCQTLQFGAVWCRSAPLVSCHGTCHCRVLARRSLYGLSTGHSQQASCCCWHCRSDQWPALWPALQPLYWFVFHGPVFASATHRRATHQAHSLHTQFGLGRAFSSIGKHPPRTKPNCIQLSRPMRCYDSLCAPAPMSAKPPHTFMLLHTLHVGISGLFSTDCSSHGASRCNGIRTFS